jgi:hypothetical protein
MTTKLVEHTNFNGFASISRMARVNNVAESTFDFYLLLNTCRSLNSTLIESQRPQFTVFYKDVWAEAYPEYKFTNPIAHSIV